MVGAKRILILASSLAEETSPASPKIVLFHRGPSKQSAFATHDVFATDALAEAAHLSDRFAPSTGSREYSICVSRCPLMTQSGHPVCIPHSPARYWCVSSCLTDRLGVGCVCRTCVPVEEAQTSCLTGSQVRHLPRCVSGVEPERHVRWAKLPRAFAVAVARAASLCLASVIGSSAHGQDPGDNSGGAISLGGRGWSATEIKRAMDRAQSGLEF